MNIDDVLNNLHFLSIYERYIVTKGLFNKLDEIDKGEYYRILTKHKNEFNDIFKRDNKLLNEINSAIISTETSIGFLIFVSSNVKELLLYFSLISLMNIAYFKKNRLDNKYFISKTIDEYITDLEKNIIVYKIDECATILDRIYADLDNLEIIKYPCWKEDALKLECMIGKYKTAVLNDEDSDMIIKELIEIEDKIYNLYQPYQAYLMRQSNYQETPYKDNSIRGLKKYS